MIQVENRTTVTMMVVCPRPNNSINIGTNDDRGALANILTHMPSTLLATFEVPIIKPRVIPRTTHIDIPITKALNVINAAAWKSGRASSINNLPTTLENGGRMKANSNWPEISHRPIQINSENTGGTRLINSIIKRSSIQVLA